MDLNKFFQSRAFKIFIASLVFFAVLLFVFKLGEFVGYNKALFSYKWGENYHKNFGGPRKGFLNDFRNRFEGRDYISPHGVFGTVIKIDGSTILVKEKDNIERIVLVSDKTFIINRRQKISLSDLKIDDNVVVLGSPNEKGQIEARLIRVFR
jgi:hypothetical protein